MGPNLMEGAQRPELLLGCIPLYNASEMDATFDEVLDGDKRLGEPVFVPRLFRNLPEMRFKRRVHESLTDGFNKLQAEGFGSTVAVGAAFVHYGDVPTYRQNMAKDDRNEALLRLGLEDDPADGELAGYLVVDLIRRHEMTEALAVGERFFGPFLDRNDHRPPGYYPENMVRIGYSLGLVQVEAGRPVDGIETIRAARRHTPDGHPNLDYVEGLAHLALNDLDEAQGLFRATRASDGRSFAQPVLVGITAELSQLRLAGIALLQGDLVGAERELPPRAGKWIFTVDLMLAEIDLARDKPEAAMQRLALYIDERNPAPDWSMLVHQALTALGSDAENLLEIAKAADSNRWLERRREALIR